MSKRDKPQQIEVIETCYPIPTQSYPYEPYIIFEGFLTKKEVKALLDAPALSAKKGWGPGYEWWGAYNGELTREGGTRDGLTPEMWPVEKYHLPVPGAPGHKRYRWLFDALVDAFLDINSINRFHLTGLDDAPWIVKHGPMSNFPPHIDYSKGALYHRYASTLQLSRPGKDHKGGQLTMLNYEAIDLAPGDLVVYDATIAHWVQTVSSGERIVVVTTATGYRHG